MTSSKKVRNRAHELDGRMNGKNLQRKKDESDAHLTRRAYEVHSKARGEMSKLDRMKITIKKITIDSVFVCVKFVFNEELDISYNSNGGKWIRSKINITGGSGDESAEEAFWNNVLAPMFVSAINTKRQSVVTELRRRFRSMYWHSALSYHGHSQAVGSNHSFYPFLC